jgi:hypothetical protein
MLKLCWSYKLQVMMKPSWSSETSDDDETKFELERHWVMVQPGWSSQTTGDDETQLVITNFR